jgi:hypothetical protein
MFVIRKIDADKLDNERYWGADGWTERAGAEVYDNVERNTLDLPVGGEWETA